ncbi:MAG: sodium:solute symporter family transporter [Myxococcota bacterium]
MTPLDIGVLVLYGCAVLALGAAAARRSRAAETSSHDWSLAGRSLPTWAAATSMIATELSAATFLGVPHAAYTGDWSYLQLAFGALAGKAILARWVIPRYHALEVVTVYGFLGRRFGVSARRAAAACFVAGRTLASGARLFIAALALSVAADWSVEASIVGCGVLCALYTRAGGLRAVVWTDILQAGVLLGGAGVLAVLLGHEAGGAGALLEWGSARGSTRVFHGSPWLSVGDSTALGTAFLGGLALTLATHGTDHDMVQRLLAARSGRAGGRALWSSAWLNFPLTALFLFIGTGLAAHYAAPGAPPPSDPARVVALFALDALPSGLRGLLFAGLFAAAMSSLDSAVCAIATTWHTDLAGRPDAAPADARRLRSTSLLASTGVVVAAIAVAAYHRALAGSDHPPALGLVEVALSSMTVLYGGLLGVFAVGLFTRWRVSPAGVIASLAGGAAVGLGLFLHPLWTGAPLIAWTWWVPLGAAAATAVAGLDAWRGRRTRLRD